jgi:hypothetical protein
MVRRVTKAVIADVGEMLNQMDDVVGDIEVRQLSEGESRWLPGEREIAVLT